MSASTKKPPSWLPAALDYGPLLIFFVAFKMTGIFMATGIFMGVILVSMAIAKWQLGRISPMMWMSAVLIIVFGGLTLYLHDETFFKMKPSIIYAMLSATLFGGLMRGKPMLKYALEHGYDGLTEKGWLLLSRNWAWFFLLMAAVNEIIRRPELSGFSTETWASVKVFGFTTASVLFAMANVPMLMKHGLAVEEETKAADEPAQDEV